jgi:hypothetical protein
MPLRKLLLSLVLAGAALASLVAINVSQYGWNVSGLLHLDVPAGESYGVPAGVVLYTDGAYDGMLYYQVARDLPALIAGTPTRLDSPYRFQRIVLPLLTYAVTLGNERAFPAALLLLNIAASLGALALYLLITKRADVHAATVILNPAILVGVLYSLTEPMSIFFMMLFFWLWLKNGQRLTWLSLAAITLSLFARETTIFLIALLMLWSVCHKQWKQAALILLPIGVLAAWQYLLVLQLGAAGFQANGNIIDLPFQGPYKALVWAFTDDGIRRMYRLASLALFAFLAALCVMLAKQWRRERARIPVFAFLLSGLCATMLSMDAHMWGAITSIGRVVTPLYPVYALYSHSRDTRQVRAVSWMLICVSVVTAVGIAFIGHPYIVSS